MVAPVDEKQIYSLVPRLNYIVAEAVNQMPVIEGLASPLCAQGLRNSEATFIHTRLYAALRIRNERVYRIDLNAFALVKQKHSRRAAVSTANFHDCAASLGSLLSQIRHFFLSKPERT